MSHLKKNEKVAKAITLGIVVCIGLCFGLPKANAIQINGNQQDTTIYVVADQEPQFNGELNRWLSDNLTYPEEASEARVEGRVFISFVVEKDGSISSIVVARSVHPALDNEAVRVFKVMPAWKPAMLNGQPVRFHVTYPLTFKLGQEIKEVEFTYVVYLDNLKKEKEMLEKGEGQWTPEEQQARVEVLRKQFGGDKELFSEVLKQVYTLKGEIAGDVKEQSKKLNLKKAEIKQLDAIYNKEIDTKIQGFRQIGEEDFIRKFVENEYGLKRLQMQKVMEVQQLLGDRFELYFKHVVMGE